MKLNLFDGVIFNTDTPSKVTTPNNRKGVILYEGPSLLDGGPIVAIATFNTTNKKTGDMIQTWILRSDLSPVKAVETGEDSSVCGKCPHRTHSGGGCYVLPFQAPRSVWEHYKRGGYDTEVNPKLFNDRRLRIGSYGDPAAVPFDVWQALVLFSNGHTGYTHQSHAENFDDRLLSICMVSVETENHAASARKNLEANTFRIKGPDSPLMEGEVLCLSESHGIKCESCGLCSGNSGVSVAVTVHGRHADKIIAKFNL